MCDVVKTDLIGVEHDFFLDSGLNGAKFMQACPIAPDLTMD